jgi:hypothetical protein
MQQVDSNKVIEKMLLFSATPIPPFDQRNSMFAPIKRRNRLLGSVSKVLNRNGNRQDLRQSASMRKA